MNLSKELPTMKNRPKQQLINLEEVVINDIQKNHKSALDTIGKFYKEHPELEESK